MATTLLKPRWEAWEKACVQAAFTHKIQHKITAAALRRTVPSVSRKIKSLGLRTPSFLSGETKNKKQNLLRREKTPQDLAKMIEILKTYAPLNCFQEGYLALKQECWTKSQPILNDNNKIKCFDSVHYYHYPFSFVKPLDFIPSKDFPLKETEEIKVKKIVGEPDYISLCYVEQWASAEGFRKTRGVLHQRGLSYWKDGAYFSQAQLLMHINRLRFEHHLQPLVLIEGEERQNLPA